HSISYFGGPVGSPFTSESLVNPYTVSMLGLEVVATANVTAAALDASSATPQSTWAGRGTFHSSPLRSHSARWRVPGRRWGPAGAEESFVLSVTAGGSAGGGSTRRSNSPRSVILVAGPSGRVATAPVLAFATTRPLAASAASRPATMAHP